MKKFHLYVLAISALLLGSAEVKAQDFAVKTNLLYDATSSVNLGIEFGLAPKWTMDISGNYNPWEFDSGMLLKHAMIQPEVRYWFCDRFSRHFLGVHVHGGIYNVGVLPFDLDFGFLDLSPLSSYRYEGWFAGAGVAYGYAFILGEHWNLELELGVGYIYTENDKYGCDRCSKRLRDTSSYHYFGPTKANIGLVYLF